MIERIVVPLDGSMTAEAILPQVRRVLYRNDSEIILVMAVDPPMVDNVVIVDEETPAAAREYLLGQGERLAQQGVRVRHIVRVGSPVSVILDVVESEKATMIALATHGASGMKRLMFGSVAERVLRQSPVPVLLVRPFWSYDLAPAGATEVRPVRNLLVPVDGTKRTLESLPGIVEFARLFETRVLLLRILEGDESATVEGPDLVRAREELEEIAKALESKGVETIQLLERGNPVDRILTTIAERNIDLVAMATHGRSGLSRLREGSVTEQVLRNAKIPLLVTRVAEPRKTASGVKVREEVSGKGN